MPILPAKLQVLRGSSVVKYGLTNLLPRSVAILSTLVITPLAIQKLGVLEYGLWALATLIPNLVSSPDFGITYGVVNEMGRVQHEKGNLMSERERLLGLARVLRLIALVWLCLGALGIGWYAFGPGTTPGVEPERMYAALMLALGIFVMGISPSLWGRVQLAQERGHEYVQWEGAGKVISFVSSLIVLWLVPNLFTLIVAALLPNVVMAMVNARRYIRNDLGPQTEPSWPLRRILQDNRRVFSAGKYYVAFQLTFLIGTAVDPFIVNGLLGAQDVTYLTVARRPFEALPLAVTLFSTALWPVFYRLNIANEIGQLKRLLGRITFGSVGILLLLSTLIVVLAGPIYGYLGQGKLIVNQVDLVWIAVQTLASTVILVFNNYMSAMDLLRSQMWVQIIASTAGLIAKYMALKYLGLSGYFPVASIVYVTLALLPMAWLTLRHLRVRQAELRRV
ncbi:lipopolysaccharide biosynthesis protein [Deinococcus ficus]|uniref:Polysaccharide biosynthesis protein n=1 Tax=Deinococcus ficus TaxID=317577 RepID=A0A221T215_9DEIO|nr:hypothetical protein [Deinococcus ficus]ASN82942.1 hypothetical protein DFI_17295 [Deinococcus ficus]